MTIQPNRDPEVSTHESEFVKCAGDFAYFCKTYVKIRHWKLGIIPFELHKYQLRYVNAMEQHRFLIMKKFRQGGFSTLAAIWALWRCMFHEDQSIFMLSKTDRECLNNSYVVKLALDEMPDWLKPKMEKDNHHQKIFIETGSKLLFYTPEAACGRSLTHLIIDEAAFIKDMDKHWKSMFPTISTGGHVICQSTPNGKDNWFAETYANAEQYKNSFVIFDTNYTEHPDYNKPEWVKETRKNLGEWGFRSEVLAEFLPPKTFWGTKHNPHPEDWKAVHTEIEADEWMKEKDTVGRVLEEQPTLREEIRKALEKEEFFDLSELIEADAKKQFGVEDLKEPKEGSTTDETTVVEFQKLSKEEIKERFKKAHEHWDKTKDQHPEQDDWHADSARDLAEWYGGRADYKDYPCKKDESPFHVDWLVDSANYYADLADMQEWEERLRECRVRYMAPPDDATAGQVAILKLIQKRFATLEKAELLFVMRYLCINGVPTRIEEDPVNYAYVGLKEFWGKEKAAETVAQILEEKLKAVF